MIPKFRGRSISEENKGQWVYGNLIVDGGCAYIVNGVIECNDQYITIAEWCPVEPKTVGAFIGLFDKNGKEIFEWDVVNAYDLDRDEGRIFKTVDLVGVVEYKGISFCLKDDRSIYNDLWINAEEYEVIGNIHEHPHLVEVGR